MFGLACWVKSTTCLSSLADGMCPARARGTGEAAAIGGGGASGGAIGGASGFAAGF